MDLKKYEEQKGILKEYFPQAIFKVIENKNSGLQPQIEITYGGKSTREFLCRYDNLLKLGIKCYGAVRNASGIDLGFVRGKQAKADEIRNVLMIDDTIEQMIQNDKEN